MQDLVRVDRIGDTAVLTLAHPPVNALSADLRLALAQALTAAIQDAGVGAIVLCGQGRGFSAGADIAEFGKPNPTVRLGQLAQMIEASPKPVIAALHGTALGGGLELALAAHYRIAGAGALLGLPEVNLGLLPGAGGTQRLPRLIGAPGALRLMLTGAPIRAAEALALGLIDRVVEQDLTAAALAMAAEGLVPRRSCDMRRGFKDMMAYQDAIAAARRAPVTLAQTRIIDCVEAAALLPFTQGLQAEEMAFADLSATPQAAGLRDAFFTERRAAVPPPAVAAIAAPQLTRLGIWGADDMAADLVFQALSAGMHVIWAAPARETLVQALGRTAARQEQAVVAGTISEDTRDADWARLTTALDPAALTSADLTLVTASVDPLTLEMGLGAVAAQGGPDTAITVPYATGGLAELSLRPDASPQAIALLMALARRLTWRLTFAGPGGPIELHLRQALAAAADHLATQGITPDQITAALTDAAPHSRQKTEIVTASLAAMAAEGARMVADGRARRPLDVDAVALLAGLLPRWMGGPMFQADRRGLPVLRQDLHRRAPEAPVFTPPTLLDDLITEGQTFASLNIL
ncbi:MAG: enoyl-CoA hydratase/isomerase family protein [Pseudorhodobacter sp.]|nr:enoyl-CoA hydratase/isomerase family protein [Pseudorhodobacter sp.]